MAPQLSMIDVVDRPARSGRPRSVADVMRPDVIELHPDVSVADALGAFERVGPATGVVVLGDRIVGYIVRSDLETVRDSVSAAQIHLRVGDVMTPQAVAGRSDWPIALAALLMEERHVPRLPVLNSHGDLVGILFRADVKAALAARLGGQLVIG